MTRPNAKSDSMSKELEKVDAQFQSFEESIHNKTLDHLNKTPAKETEPQVKLSNRQMHQVDPIELKPMRSISSKEPFNEAFREQWKEAMQKVLFVAENNEVKGETIHCWTKGFPGEAAQEWKVPVNKVVRGPRHLAQRICHCLYHRLKTDDNVVTEAGTNTTFHGAIVVDETVNRLNARPAGTPFMAMGG